MVRQLGIEQQIILQPAAPVAMRNKAVLCRPLSICRKVQVDVVDRACGTTATSGGGAGLVNQAGMIKRRNDQEEAMMDHDGEGLGDDVDDVCVAEVAEKRRQTMDAETDTTDMIDSSTQETTQVTTGEHLALFMFSPYQRRILLYITG